MSSLTSTELSTHDFKIRFANQSDDMQLFTDGTAHMKHDWVETKDPDGMRIKKEVPDTVVKWKFEGEKLHIDGAPDMTIGARNGHIYSASGQVVGDITYVSPIEQDSSIILKTVDAMRLVTPAYTIGADISQYLANSETDKNRAKSQQIEKAQVSDPNILNMLEATKKDAVQSTTYKLDWAY